MPSASTTDHVRRHAPCLRSPGHRGRRAHRVGREPRLAHGRGRPALSEREVLRVLDVAVPVRQAAHGSCAQLHDQRRARALPAHVGLQRADADGLGRLRHAGRERGHRPQGAAGAVDLRQHRHDEGAVRRDRAGHRLVARGHDLQARLLPLEPVAVPQDAREGHRVSQDRQGELGPRRPDGARQRAGDRWPRLAIGCDRREARDPDVLPAHHRLRGRVARFARRARLARARQDDAEELDRPQRGGDDRVPIRPLDVRGPGRRRARRRARDAACRRRSPRSRARACCACSPRGPIR